jgi:hypothetical protein
LIGGIAGAFSGGVGGAMAGAVTSIGIGQAICIGATSAVVGGITARVLETSHYNQGVTFAEHAEYVFDPGAVGRDMLWGTAGGACGYGLSRLPVSNQMRTPVIGRMNDLNSVGANEFRIADSLPHQGSPGANWRQNSSVLRRCMRHTSRIRDASSFDSIADPRLGVIGTRHENSFLHMERNLLYNRGWRYNNGYWTPNG